MPDIHPKKAATDAIYIELDTERKIRHRNKTYYRVLHWPIWIFVFFIAPGPWTFDLFAKGFDARLGAWLGVVLVGTASSDPASTSKRTYVFTSSVNRAPAVSASTALSSRPFS